MSIAILLIGVLALVVLAAVIALIVILATKNRNDQSSVSAGGMGSYFDGSTLQWIGWRILTNIIITLTLGIAYPWAMCMMTRWEVKHTVINGRRLKFNGNGAQLFGKYILWAFLTLITLGIYSIWFGLGMEKWKVKHTVYADDASPVESRFSGTAGGWFLNHLLLFLLTLITFGIAAPWASVRIMKWKASHTVIGGSPLIFEGRGLQLWGKYLLLGLLTPLTLGIYALFFPVSLLKWQYKHTVALYRTAPIIALSRAHEQAALKDYAKIRLAANDTELAAVKSGFTGAESVNELENLAQNGNPYAQYALARILKGENERFEDRALELLKSASDAGYHPAMFDYAPYIESTDERIKLYEESAKHGNTSAPWLLKQLYEEKANSAVVQTNELKLGLLTKAAYWFKIAIELEIPEAVASKAQYDKLCEALAILHCGNKANVPASNSNGGVIAAIIAGAVVLVLVVAGVLVAVLGLFRGTKDEARPVQMQTVMIAQGSSTICTVKPGELFRYDASKYKNYEYEDNNFSSSEAGVSVKGYLSDTAYYDADTKTLFIDFGIAPDSRVEGSQKFSAYLVCEDVLREDGSCAVFSGTVEPGERILSVPCDLPAGKTSTKLHVVIYNGLANERNTISAAVSPNGNVVINTENANTADSNKWVMDIHSKKIKITYEPIQSPDLNGSPEGSMPPESTPENDQSAVESIPDNTPDHSAELMDELVGSWTTAVLEGETLYLTTFVFNADGTLELYDSEYLNAADHPGLFGDEATGWHPAPMGFPATYGTYSLNDNGNTLSICYTHDDIEEFTPIYVTGHVLEMHGDSMLFKVTSEYADNQPHAYLKNQMYTSVEDLCEMLGVELY